MKLLLQHGITILICCMLLQPILLLLLGANAGSGNADAEARPIQMRLILQQPNTILCKLNLQVMSISDAFRCPSLLFLQNAVTILTYLFNRSLMLQTPRP